MKTMNGLHIKQRTRKSLLSPKRRGGRKMKKITITLDADVVAMLDSAALSSEYCYSKEQAYGHYISDLIREGHTVKSSECRQCMDVPPHCHPPSWWI